MNSALVELPVDDWSPVSLLVVLGIALATAPAALGFGGGNIAQEAAADDRRRRRGISPERRRELAYFGSDGFGGGNVSHANSYSQSGSHSYVVLNRSPAITLLGVHKSASASAYHPSSSSQSRPKIIPPAVRNRQVALRTTPHSNRVNVNKPRFKVNNKRDLPAGSR